MTVLSLSTRQKYGTLLAGNAAFNPYAFRSIATVTVGSGGAANVEFTSIPQTYTHLQIRGIARASSDSESLRIKYNSDTGNNYSRHLLYGDGSTALAWWGSGDNIAVIGDMATSTSPSSVFGAFVTDILDYNSVNKHKTVRSLSGKDLNGSGYIQLRSHLYKPASIVAISSIEIWFPSSNIAQYSSFALYGIKSSI